MYAEVMNENNQLFDMIGEIKSMYEEVMNDKDQQHYDVLRCFLNEAISILQT
jgi:hypothetical protein